MILSRDDCKIYLKEDYRVNHFVGLKSNFNPIKKFLFWLRKTEYLCNCRKWKIRIIISKYFLNKYSLKCCFSIPINSVGKGIFLPHLGYINVNPKSTIGDYCIIQSGVVVATDVTCGNNVYLSAGSKVLKNVRLMDYVIVGANSVVTEGVYPENCVIVGVPSKIISYEGMKNRKTEI